MCEEAKWKEYLEDFLVGAEGNYEHSQTFKISKGRAVTQHKLFSATETIEWNLDKKTKEITGVKHLGR